MRNDIINALVAAGGIVLAAAIIGGVGFVFRLVRTLRENTTAINELREAIQHWPGIEQRVKLLEDWRIRTEAAQLAVSTTASRERE